jgi:prephenate dehydrogenase
MRIAVLGVGLIGGSVGLAAADRLGASVAGWDPSGQALRAAVDRGAVREPCDDVAAACAGADAVFCCAPVAALPALIASALAACDETCVITDVGSTKRAIVADVDDPRFLGGHPLAGAETSGVAHARADLFDGATWYLTPRQDVSGVLYERLHRLLSALGARPAAIDADTHDRVLAAVSHLPHVLANVLVAQAAATLSAGGEGLPATGPSFRDATRVAGAPSTIWTDIYLANRDALVVEIDGALARLAAVRDLLGAGDGDGLSAWNDGAGVQRETLLGAQMPGGALCELRASVPNSPGVVARIALALGRAGVNIADMRLSPAVDMRDGVISLWVSGEAEAARATALIDGLGFTVARS